MKTKKISAPIRCTCFFGVFLNIKSAETPDQAQLLSRAIPVSRLSFLNPILTPDILCFHCLFS
ncbi:MAG: hypothetical protein PHC91_10760, partial [Eubacteriales bacterium]|nr:hypothetical protein [Eubacteriales bacterium]